MKIEINGEFIKLGQLLKKIGKIDTGGQSKYFIETTSIMINQKNDPTRNTKVFKKDVVIIDGEIFFIV